MITNFRVNKCRVAVNLSFLTSSVSVMILGRLTQGALHRNSLNERSFKLWRINYGVRKRASRTELKLSFHRSGIDQNLSALCSVGKARKTRKSSITREISATHSERTCDGGNGNLSSTQLNATLIKWVVA